MGNNKSLVDLRGSINSNCMRVDPYGVDRAYSALTKVECLLLINTIFMKYVFTVFCDSILICPKTGS